MLRQKILALSAQLSWIDMSAKSLFLGLLDWERFLLWERDVLPVLCTQGKRLWTWSKCSRSLFALTHGPVYIYISGHFHKARIRIFAVSIIIHFVSTLYVDMPILNWPSTQAIFWWGRGDPWSIDDRTSTNILYEYPGAVPHGQFQGSAEKRFERARHGSITKNCCLPPTAYHIDFQCVTCPYDRSEYCKVL